MNVCILFLLLVYKATRCSKTPELQTTLIVPEIDDKCKNIKCSSQEDPTCIKIKHLRDIKKVVNVIALNKCEIQFMKCYKDYEAKIVPIKLCGHKKDLVRKVKAHNTTVTSNGRVKRHVSGGDSNKRDYDTYDKSYSEEGGYKVLKDDIYDENQTWALKGRLADGPGPVVLIGGADSGGGKLSSEISGAKSEDDKSRSNELADQGQFALFSQETITYRRKKAAESVTDNNEDCPESCPAQNQMICAKCQHGVYKTFPSTCHLRQFACNYVNESLQLVARYPCVLSAPYIAVPGEIAEGKVVNPNDNDIILNFIKCRSLGILGKQSPRCPF